MFVLTCPNCGANLSVDENREFAFCQYCGTKLSNFKNDFKLDRTDEINNLIIRALEYEQKGDFQKCTDYCARILDMDPYNIKAREIEMRLPLYSSGPNVTITYRSVHDDRYKLRVTLDGKNWKILNKDETIKIELPVGKHRIFFSGKKAYNYDVTISKKTQKITIIYTADKHRNTIEQY